MNRATLERLKANPHYKISSKQFANLEDEERAPMIEIGKVPNNQTKVQKHPTSPKRVVRKGAYVEPEE